MNYQYTKVLALSLIPNVLLSSANLPMFTSNSVVAQTLNSKQSQGNITQRLNKLDYQGNYIAVRLHFVVSPEQIDEFINPSSRGSRLYQR